MSKLNKRTILFLMLCIISIFIGCNKKDANYEPTINDIALKTNSTDVDVISKQIMIKFFDEYKKDSVKKELRIKDYKINNIKYIEVNKDKFNFSIEYSVKPKYLDLYDIAGNGEKKDDWIINKDAFISVQKNDKEYIINAMSHTIKK